MTAQTAAPAKTTPSRKQRLNLGNIWRDSLTVFWGDWLDLRSRITQVAASGLISPIIYIVAFGLGLGSSINSSGGVSPEYPDISYLEFILPGMAALSSMAISFGGTTFSICGERLFSKTFEEMLLLPVHPLSLHIGKMMAGILRGLMTSGSVALVAIIFTQRIGSFLNPLFWLVLILNCAVFSGVGVITGLRVKSLESVSLYNNFLIVPMSFLGATFFDPATLPGILKVVVYCLPLTYATTALRAAAYRPLVDFPWINLVVLSGLALLLCGAGAYQFSNQRD